MTDFYDELAPLYHLIHEDWDESVHRKGEQLSLLIKNEWPGKNCILDVSCGIGTQALGLAKHGYSVTASDLSEKEVERARHEAERYGVHIDFSVCDMRKAHAHHGTGFEIVLSGDNSLPHLLTDDDLSLALHEMFTCLAPGGGCVITVRHYDAESRGKNLVKPYGTRIENGKRYFLFQVWGFEDECYDLTFIFVEEDLLSRDITTRAMRSKYYAISTEKLCHLMGQAGFENVRHIDGIFFSPYWWEQNPITRH